MNSWMPCAHDKPGIPQNPYLRPEHPISRVLGARRTVRGERRDAADERGDPHQGIYVGPLSKNPRADGPGIEELETRLELATYGLQDRCGTDCATPAGAGTWSPYA
mgnify:CR=1 FL=1